MPEYQAHSCYKRVIYFIVYFSFVVVYIFIVDLVYFAKLEGTNISYFSKIMQTYIPILI